MFSTVSRKLKGPIPTQIFTPEAFDDFLSTKVFNSFVPVKRLHTVADMKQLFEPHFNTKVKGLGHQGWRPGQILKSQRVRALERLKNEKPDIYAEMMKTKSLIIPDAQADFLLEDFDVLREMCRGHDGKNPNHVIRFVMNPTSGKCIVQYKHFCFDDRWRPNLVYNKFSGQWEADSTVTYSWFSPGTDLQKLASTTPTNIREVKAIEQAIYDNVAKCVGTMANFTRETMSMWDSYFAFLDELRRNPVCTIPILSPKQLNQEAELLYLKSSSQTSEAKASHNSTLQLSSVYGADCRESLVASNKAVSVAWAQDMEDMRLSQRVARVESG